ncbi:transcription factor A, mitochondrial isoform X1 [Chelonia mydas]|uniref:transcription factor A, mitochondrial isoform X1 n=1 Tax=Chelonia mydas TaxID=8469 RepID=UPI0018A20D1D|nr:transcription factor A, mitochondrial isoform X1 [Chelonia mydas]XP_037761269.1 transcription factor A, mitochondrial isoform X1 [Chelonia mydas]
MRFGDYLSRGPVPSKRRGPLLPTLHRASSARGSERTPRPVFVCLCYGGRAAGPGPGRFSQRPAHSQVKAPPGASGETLECSTTYSVEKWFSKQISSDNPPKRPLTAYFRFVKDQQPIFREQNPDVSILEIAKKIAYAWKELPVSEKQTYEAAAKVERQAYKEELAIYKAQLSPAQIIALKEERRQKRAKRKAMRKKRELTVLGKPKRPRTGFNIFMSEHFQEAKGVSVQAKMKNLFEEWQDLSNSQKQTYLQLAEDDKVRYENEMKSWEEQMVDVGREDLIRYKNRRLKKSRATTEKKTVKKVISKKRVKTIKIQRTKDSSSPEVKAKLKTSSEE